MGALRSAILSAVRALNDIEGNDINKLNTDRDRLRLIWPNPILYA